MVLYLLKSKYLLDHCINLHKDFLNKIKSSYIYFDYIWLTHQQNIIEITVNDKIVKKVLLDINKIYNNRRHVV